MCKPGVRRLYSLLACVSLPKALHVTVKQLNRRHAVGGAKEIEVQVCNPSDERVELTASYGHNNLVGPESITLDAQQTDQFSFYFSPVVAGKCTAKFTLHNQQLGEFWYEVRMSTA